MAEPIELSADLEAKIVASIRAGGYAPVAAQAWGVPEALLERWLKRGRRKNARDPYRRFASEVDRALGQARLKAEMEAYKKDPRTWLKHGPGKELPGRPGWSAPVKSTDIPESSQAASLFDNADWLHLLSLVRQLLANYPDALERLDQLIANR